MRLTKLQIQNFRNIRNATLDIGNARYVVIRGLNHAGKSSIREAISMLLATVTEGLDALGRGFIAKIMHEEEKAVICGEIQGREHLVQRTITLNTNATGRDARTLCLDDKTWHPLPFENFLEYRKPALAVALNTDYFLVNFSEAQQKDLMGQLVLPETFDFPPDKIKATEQSIGPGVVNFKGNPMEAITKAYKKLYDERTAVNRQIRDFAIPDAIPIPTGKTSTAIQHAVSEAQDKRRQIDLKKTEAMRKAGDANAKRARLEERIAGHERKVNEERQRLSTITKDIMPQAKHKSAKEYAEKKAQLDTLESQRRTNTATIDELKREKARYEQQAEALPESGANVCPTCGREIDTDALVRMDAAADARLKTALEADNNLLRAINDLGPVEQAIAALSRHDAAVQQKASIDDILAEKSKAIRKDREELSALPAASDAGTEFDQQLIDADNEVTRLMDELRPIVAAEERAKEIDRKRKELSELQQKVAVIDGLVKYFDKDGIKADLLKQHIGGFTEKINHVLAAWPYRCEFTIDPYEFRAGDANRLRLTSIQQLSKSEKLMFHAALQTAITQVAGIGLAVIDQMDTFLPEERGKLNQKIWEMVKADQLEQAFLIVSDTSTSIPTMPPGVETAFFFVDNGNVRRI